MGLIVPEFLQTKSYRAIRDRLAFQHGGAIQAGVWNAGDFKVTQRASSANMSVDVAAGFALVSANDPGNLGLYHIQNDATVNVPFVATESNPRIDQVVLTINDSTDGGDPGDTPVLQVIKGTAIGGVTLDAPGASKGTVPNGSLVLADVLVPANSDATGIITANIRDRRLWARGFRRHLQRTSGDYTITSAAMVLIDPGNLTPRVECNGVNEFEITMRSRFLSSVPTLCALVPSVDGSSLYSLAPWRDTPPNTADHPLQVTFPFLPTAGSHVLGMNGSTSSGSFTIAATASAPLDLTIIEHIRQNADNT